MKRTIKSLGVALGPAALIPLMMACTRPAETPTAPTTEPVAPSAQPPPSVETPAQAPAGPTSELGTREKGARGPEAPKGHEAQPAQPAQPQQPGLGSGLGQQAQPGEQPAPGETGAPAANERALCEALAKSARLRVEDVQGGVAIVATPRAGTDLSTVREEAQRLENSIRTGAAEGQAGGAQRGVRSAETCGIAELGRLPSVSVQLTEGGNAVRILMTTSNTAEVRDLRRIARDEIGALMKSVGGPAKPHKPQPQKPQPQKPDEKPRPGGPEHQP